MKWLQDSLTGKDNLTYDAARLVGVIGAAAYVFFWAAAVFNFGHFSATDAAAYGAGPRYSPPLDVGSRASQTGLGAGPTYTTLIRGFDEYELGSNRHFCPFVRVAGRP
jgi:hypothetical protein